MAFKLKKNPFTNQPLDNPNIFAGRENEIFYMVNSLYQTAKGKSKHVFVTGERGIGKSSYAKQIELIANGDRTLVDRINIDTSGHFFNFVTSKHICTEGNTIEQIVQSLLDTLRNEIYSLPQINAKEWGIKFELNLGIIKAGAETKGQIGKINPELINHFVSILKDLTEKISFSSEGIVLIIDELDRVVDNSFYGSFFKALTERLMDNNLTNISLILIGINGTMKKLTSQHESVRRIFHEIEIPLLSVDERKQVVINALAEVEANVDIGVLDEIAKISDGFPAPIHVIGESVYDADEDGFIDLEDFNKGLEKVIKYVKKSELKDKLKGAGSGRYQKMLRIMATYYAEDVPLSHISQELGVDHPRNYSTNIKKLLNSGMIEKVDIGVYRLKDKLLGIYIKNVAMLEEIDEDEDDEDTGNDLNN